MLLVAAPLTAAAQKPAQFLGFVLVDGSEKPLPGAMVEFTNLGLSALTDSLGHFRIAGIRPGNHVVSVRKLGFAPVRSVVALGEADSVDTDILLAVAAQSLAEVTVEAKPTLNAKMSEFESRRISGIGKFVTREVIEKNENRQMAELLVQIGGPHILRGNSGGKAWAIGGRGVQSVMRNGPTLSLEDRTAGAKPTCYAAVLLDGAEVYGGHDGQPLFDVNSVRLTDVTGIEYYRGPAEMPPKYNGTRATCGLLVIWTR
ncbi:MAG: CarboxypepD reg-like domain-containing protein/TonB-dependent Receptor Plug Domain [Verrucomicrobia bacterium]|nr:MAG: CarboxypepD reg-like domain-containing protein/TonB-dependent Receptor Plug Domain [Verrucomicrobiota bacterium]